MKKSIANKDQWLLNYALWDEDIKTKNENEIQIYN